METILAALAVGTIWFYLIIALASIIFVACIENDHYTAPSIIALILGIIYWKSIATFGWQAIAVTVGIYAITGVVWSVFKWYRFVQKAAAEYHNSYGNVLTPSQKAELKNEVSVTDNKARLTSWIAWWPWSLAWALTGDFVNMLYDTMTNAYQKISDHALGKFTVDAEFSKEKSESKSIRNSCNQR